MSDTAPRALPRYVTSPSFPFDGQLRVKHLDSPAPEPDRLLLDHTTCASCQAPDDTYVWVSERWRVRAGETPGGLPMVLVLESRSHLDLGDLPNMLAAELGVMTVRVERAIRSLDNVAHVQVTRHSEDSTHLQFEFHARPTGRRQLAGPFVAMWNDILPSIDVERWHEDLALIAAWLGEFGGRAVAEPPRIIWHAPSSFAESTAATAAALTADAAAVASAAAAGDGREARAVGGPGSVDGTDGAAVPGRDGAVAVVDGDTGSDRSGTASGGRVTTGESAVSGESATGQDAGAAGAVRSGDAAMAASGGGPGVAGGDSEAAAPTGDARGVAGGGTAGAPASGATASATRAASGETAGAPVRGGDVAAAGSAGAIDADRARPTTEGHTGGEAAPQTAASKQTGAGSRSGTAANRGRTDGDRPAADAGRAAEANGVEPGDGGAVRGIEAATSAAPSGDGAEATEEDTYDDEGRAVGRAAVDGDAPAQTARGVVALPRQNTRDESMSFLNDMDLDMSQLR